MPLTKEQKGVLVKSLTEKMKAAKSVIFADFKGLSVADVYKLRGEMRKQDVSFKVAKRTLFRIAAKEAGYAEIPDDALEGSVGAAFSLQDEVAGAKILYKFAKKNKNLQLRGALFDGRVLTVEETNQLAQIPSKEELLAKFVYLLKSPIQGFHGVLQNTMSGFVRALDAISKKQGQAV